MLWGMCKNGNPESEKTMGKKLPYQVLLVTFRTEDLPVLFPLKVLLSWWKCYEQAMAHAHTHTHTHTHMHRNPGKSNTMKTSLLVSEDQGLFGHLHWGCLFSRWCLKKLQSDDATCSDACTGTRNPAHRAGKPVWMARKKEKKKIKKEEEKCKHKRRYNRNGIQTFSRPRHSSHIAFKETQPGQEGNYS